jgi:glycine/D-amino acid oxidase-like deaminating enzyme
MLDSPLDRRRLLGAGSLAAAGLALPGCATPRAAATPPGCLPAVDVDPGRVIRHVVGLRPYRAAGFVVRAEPLGATRLVHNYGHGGGGITLSWGSSRLATQLGLPGHGGPVAVIGAGIMGLTTARLVQEAGFPVTIYTAALPPDTTSNIAGGQWGPFSVHRDDAVTPDWRAQFAAALDYSWRRFQIMVGDDYGVRWVTTYNEGVAPAPADLLHRYHPAGRQLARSEHPFPLERVFRYETMYVETGRFLRQLQRDIEGSGGRIVVRSFAAPAEIAALPERLVFNCTGLGAARLFGDAELTPIRGQLAVLLPQPEVRYAFAGEAGYMFPRADGIILGGTFERGNWSTEVDPATAARIVAAHRELFGRFRC